MSSRKTALVTGAAARIGACTAETLHARGCDVLLHCNSSVDRAESLADRLNGIRPDSAAVASADLSSLDDIQSLAEAFRARFDRLDILVNNASRFYPTQVGETQVWEWEDLINSNLRGPYFLVQALLEDLKTGGGSVINIVDIYARRPLSNHGVYVISKAGLEMMTQSMAAELGPTIRVNGVSPGAILWPENESDDSAKQAVLDKTVMKRIGEADDIATAVAYFALDAPYVTGQILAVDGGRSLNM
ncbi:MAG: pteridine reductase [Xanthomonadales bacterium]|nr:pteridine reductase [Gammaproteobacteria bacterium]MBT8050213.1 pteridine reductase [Gammaproteobacteria bacterium]MBT8056232.1 pteridine reductase [Gammaproteobacteria bacterium]NNJ77904.1 pteridine reductase [Xanthomonadales bacterium]NNL04089.1 pteridine reductase [Xanthomonadales bacterium]